MAMRMPTLNPPQLEAQSVVVAALAEGGRFERAGQRLGELEDRKVWLSRMPLWPFALDLVELLAVVAQERFAITPAEFAGEVTDVLANTPSAPLR